MRPFIFIALLSFSTVLNAAVTTTASPKIPFTCPSYREEAAYWNLVAETTQYYMDQGYTRSPKTIATFLGSSMRVASMTSGFPAADLEERTLRLFSWGSRESGYRESFYQVNIPGKSYKGLPAGVVVKAMSVDFGWSGLNEGNVNWTYRAALCVQNGEPFPKWINNMLAKDTQEFIRANLVIPQKFKLKKIDLESAKSAHRLYRSQLKKGISPEKMKIWVDYKEKTPDELDSLLIYRWLVEVDRCKRGWKWRTWDADLYPRLKKAVSRYPKNPR